MLLRIVGPHLTYILDTFVLQEAVTDCNKHSRYFGTEIQGGKRLGLNCKLSRNFLSSRLTLLAVRFTTSWKSAASTLSESRQPRPKGEEVKVQ